MMKKINTKKGLYLYDEYSNSIVRIGDSKEELTEKEVHSSYQELIEEGVFNAPYDVDVTNFTSNEIKERLEPGATEITLNLTHDCNLRCKYCTYSGNYKNSREKSLNIDNYEVEYSIVTNGTLLSSRYIEFLVENNIRLYVSLDGSRELHDDNRVFEDGKPTFEVIHNNLKKIRELKRDYYEKNVFFQVTISPPYNIKNVVNYFENEILFKDKVPMLSFVNSVDMEQSMFNKTQSNLSQSNLFESIDRFVDDFSNKNRPANGMLTLWGVNLKLIHNRRPIDKGVGYNLNGICVPGERSFFVDYNGDILICEKLDNFLPVGDVYKGFDYKKISGLIQVYRSFVVNRCTKCWARNFCTDCFISIAGKNKISFADKDKFCETKRLQIKNSMTIYLNIYEKNPEALDSLLY